MTHELGRREVVLILGQTGSGKTTYAKHYADKYTRVILADADFKEFPVAYFQTQEELVAHLEMKQAQKPHSFFRAGWTPSVSEFPFVFDLAKHIGPCTLILEECDRFGDPETIFEYEDMIARGRHYGVNLICISRFPFSIPPMLRREATRIIAFRMVEPRDVDFLEKVMGECAEQIPFLKPYEFLEWTQESDGKIFPQTLDIQKAIT